jgi:hypothetical protein
VPRTVTPTWTAAVPIVRMPWTHGPVPTPPIVSALTSTKTRFEVPEVIWVIVVPASVA